MRWIQLLIFGCLFSCQENERKPNAIESNSGSVEAKPPVIRDTFDYKTSLKRVQEFGVASYNPLYFGLWDDTIPVNYRIRHSQPPPVPPPPPLDLNDSIQPDYDIDKSESIGFLESEYSLFESYFPIYPLGNLTTPDSADLLIRVDTTQIIRNIDFTEIQNSTFAFQAYPVYVINQSRDTAIVGFGSYISLIMEARDTIGKWKPIEHDHYFFCGTGLPTIILPPKQIVLTSATIQQGDFPTDLRLRMGPNVSNSFKGSIYISQFEDDGLRHRLY